MRQPTKAALYAEIERLRALIEKDKAFSRGLIEKGRKRIAELERPWWARLSHWWMAL